MNSDELKERLVKLGKIKKWSSKEDIMLAAYELGLGDANTRAFTEAVSSTAVHYSHDDGIVRWCR